MRRFLSMFLTAVLFLTVAMGARAEIGGLKGFDKKVYDGALALYASSEMTGLHDRFICSVHTVAKIDGGYLLIGAGHCTSVNGDLPPDLTFKVSRDIGSPLMPVQLLAARMEEKDDKVGHEVIDWALYFFPTKDEYPVIPMGNENKAKLNDPTIDVNFTMGLAKEVSMGLVSSKVMHVGPIAGFMEITQFDSHGASGSSVVDERTKEIIGLVIAGFDGETVPSLVEPISVIKTSIRLAFENHAIEGIPLIQARIEIPDEE